VPQLRYDIRLHRHESFEAAIFDSPEDLLEIDPSPLILFLELLQRPLRLDLGLLTLALAILFWGL